MNFRLLLSGIPVAVFYLLTRMGPPWLAILGGFVASAIVFYFIRKDRLIGILTIVGFAIVTFSAIVGIISDNEKAYLASGAISDFAFVPIHVVSVLMRRPLVGGVARELFPNYVGRVPIGHPVFMTLGIAWAVYELLHGFLRLYLLQELSVGQYLVWSRVIGSPPTALMFMISAWFIMRAAKIVEDRDPLAEHAAGHPLPENA